jgi:uncharacterized repeat protein (TIGR04138 family)
MPKRQSDPEITIEQVAQRDGRYSPQAYYFVFEALRHTQQMLGKNPGSPNEIERHVTGQQLLEGIRQLAIQEFGYMARVVLEQWGVRQASDFGEIVFILVSNGLMGKTDDDSLDDFRGGYDFRKAFDEQFKFVVMQPPGAPTARPPKEDTSS